MNFPEKLQQKLTKRSELNALRSLQVPSNLVDFYSNDYLGFAKSKLIFEQTHQLLLDQNFMINGATGSRLLSGNHRLYKETEELIAKFHNSEKALLFNSGYDANLGFFSAVPQRGDIILYDELIHASIRDGIQLSNAKAYKFKHNDIIHLEKQIASVRELSNSKETLNEDSLQSKSRTQKSNVFIITESVFSMDGDSPDLVTMTKIANQYNTYLIVDEAHALGVFGSQGKGLVQQLSLEKEIFARIVTYGKALGCHGAAILGSTQLYTYLVNFSRSLIYTTGLPPHAIATIQIAYTHLQQEIIDSLHNKIQHFINEIHRLQLTDVFIKSNSAIHCCIISGTTKTKAIATQIQQKRFNVKPILSPTVPKGEERLRFCLHSFNSKDDISTILTELKTLIHL